MGDFTKDSRGYKFWGKIKTLSDDALKNEPSSSIYSEGNSSHGSALIQRNKKIKYWLFGLGVSFPVLLLSLLTTYTVWFTELYSDEVLKILALKEGGLAYHIWKDSSMPNIIYFYAYNYTNVPEIMAGKQKPKVEELGPYAFRETVKRVNVVHDDTGTISFQNYRTHEYMPELSRGDMEDEIMVPNIPLMSSLQPQSNSVSWGEKLALAGLLAGLKSKPFLRLKIEDFTWGFGDTFAVVSKKIAQFLGRPVPDKFGILAMRGGLNNDNITIGTGMPDLSKYGIIRSFNGKERIEAWEQEECDSFEASDGSLFPGKSLSPESTLYLYVKDFCRRLPMHYVNEVKVDEFSAYRFAYRKNLFYSASLNPDNKCFCDGPSCPPSGVMATGKCMYGAPLAVSFPHFLHGNTSLQESIIGLQPDFLKHWSYMDIHKTLGIPIAGHNRFQMNIIKGKNFILPIYKNIPDGTVLPLAWMDFEIEKMSEDVYSVIKEITNKSYIVEQVLCWGSIIVAAISTAVCLVSISKVITPFI